MLFSQPAKTDASRCPKKQTLAEKVIQIGPLMMFGNQLFDSASGIGRACTSGSMAANEARLAAHAWVDAQFTQLLSTAKYVDRVNDNRDVGNRRSFTKFGWKSFTIRARTKSRSEQKTLR